jgi:SAM-dependent methyltransferase
MSLLQRFKHSAFWQPFARVYQQSGLKARVYSRSVSPPVKTITEAALFAQLNLHRVTPAALPVFDPPVRVDAGPMPAEDAAFFARFIAALAPQEVFEFGTNWGVSTAIIAANTPPSTRIRTLDVCREMFSAEHLSSNPELQMILSNQHTGWQWQQDETLRPKVEQVFADSLTFEMPTTPQCDFILVDACHQYDFIRKDTENALRCLAPGGCLLWHDFYPQVSSWQDVFLYLTEFARRHAGVVHIEGTHFAFWQAPR